MRLLRVEGFEHFIKRTYLGAKQFSIEGLDVMILMLDEAVAIAARDGIADVTLGMSHRGRLNAQAHVLRLPYAQIMAEFEGERAQDIATRAPAHGTGDVKYHYGASNRRQMVVGPDEVRDVHVTLLPNPSHLEFVDPVVIGRTRALQTAYAPPASTVRDPRGGFAILVHGDASFAGQGVVAETLNLQSLRGYSVGGTLHVIANNQVGFTTDPVDGRSTRHSSDLAKGFNVPIIHVNADDVAACRAAMDLAMAFRARFARDVVIDLVGYRRWGHNEGDEPAYTQPVMVRAHPPAPDGRHALRAAAAGAGRRRRAAGGRHARAHRAPAVRAPPAHPQGGRRSPRAAPEPPATVRGIGTTVDAERLRRAQRGAPDAARGLHAAPQAVAAARAPAHGAGRGGRHRLGRRRGAGLRQPARRRHRRSASPARTPSAARSPTATSCCTTWRPARRTRRCSTSRRPRPASRCATRRCPRPRASASSTATPSPGPTRWCCGRRSSATSPTSASRSSTSSSPSGRAKWGQLSQLTLLLPHGYEGNGPEHSSARLERFLNLAAEDNLMVAYPTTPAQYFHLLRLQAHPTIRRPLIVMTPKSLLRLRESTSRIEELAEGSFRPVIDDAAAQDWKEDVSRLVLCAGKVYYDIQRHPERKRRRTRPRSCASSSCTASRRRRSPRSWPPTRSCSQVVWAQEEPQNMGAWRSIRHRLESVMPPGVSLRYEGRPWRAVDGGGLRRRTTCASRTASCGPRSGCRRRRSSDARSAALTRVPHQPAASSSAWTSKYTSARTISPSRQTSHETPSSSTGAAPATTRYVQRTAARSSSASTSSTT